MTHKSIGPTPSQISGMPTDPEKNRSSFSTSNIGVIVGIPLIAIAALGALAALVIFTAPAALPVAAAILTTATPLAIGLSLGGCFLLGSIFLLANCYTQKKTPIPPNDSTLVRSEHSQDNRGFTPRLPQQKNETAPLTPPSDDTTTPPVNLLPSPAPTPSVVEVPGPTSPTAVEPPKTSPKIEESFSIDALCTKSGGILSIQTTPWPIYHGLWQLLFNKDLKFAFYPSSSGEKNHYSSIKIVDNQLKGIRYVCSSLSDWQRAIAHAEMSDSPSFQLRSIEDVVRAAFPCCKFWNTPNKSDEELLVEGHSFSVVHEVININGTSTWVFGVLYRDSQQELIRHNIAKPFDLSVIEEIAELVGFCYPEGTIEPPAAAAGSEEAPSPTSRLLVPRSWQDLYKSSMGDHEWGGFAKTFGSGQGKPWPFSLKNKGWLECSSAHIGDVANSEYGVRSTYKNQMNYKYHVEKQTYCLAFQTPLETSVKSFLIYMNDEYGLGSRNYYSHCIKPGEELQSDKDSAFARMWYEKPPTGSGSKAISAYIHPFEFQETVPGEGSIDSGLSDLNHGVEKVFGGFLYPESLKEIVHTEIERFYAQHPIAELNKHLPNEVSQIVTEYLGEAEVARMARGNKHVVQKAPVYLGYARVK